MRSVLLIQTLSDSTEALIIHTIRRFASDCYQALRTVPQNLMYKVYRMAIKGGRILDSEDWMMRGASRFQKQEAARVLSKELPALILFVVHIL